MFFMLPIGYGGGGILGFIIIFLIIRTIARLLFRSRRGSGQDQNSNGYHYYYYNGNGYSQGSQYQYQQQQQQRAYGQSGSRDPYAVLGVTNSASDDDIKKAYRKLIMENHPDRVMDKSDAEKKQAEKRFREVQDAYERICKLRGIN